MAGFQFGENSLLGAKKLVARSTENFHVFGPGVDKRTGLVFRGTVRWKVRFATGRYRYRSDAHPRLQRFFTARVQSSTN